MDFDNRQPESKNAFYHLEICCRYVGEKYGNANISKWTNRDYIILSGALSRHTDVQISPNTLKRIFGKLKTPERYFPQKATRDTLARYAGFSDWEAFVQQHPRPTFIPAEPVVIPAPVQHASSSIEPVEITKKQGWPIIAASTALVLLLLVAMFTYRNNTGPVDTTGVQLICNNPDGTNPHSAVFKIKLPENFRGNEADFQINFGDGRTPRAIQPSKLVTHYYEIPGRYYPVLLYNNKILDTVSVYLKTEGWTATANLQSDTLRVYPVPATALVKDHKLRVSTMDLYRSGVDTNRTFFVRFVNAFPMDISGDNFELTVNFVSSSERPGVRCSQVDISVFGEKAKHLIRAMKPGCASFNSFRLSDNDMRGESEDLSALAKDFTKGGQCRLRVKDRKGQLWLNEKLVYKAAYKVGIGQVFGIEVLFSGIGELQNLVLTDLNTGHAFRSNF